VTLRERERAALSGDGQLQVALRRSTDAMSTRWAATRAELADPDGLREAARSLRSAAIARLPELLAQLADRVQATGAHVFFAADAEEATSYIAGVADGKKLAVKSKSMVTEEIGLNAALAAVGVEAIETDLGEWVQQLDHEPPAHILGPAMHKTRADWVRVLAREGYEGGDDPDAMTAFARRTLRRKFLEADLGITGVNLAIAETGTVMMVTNEGNGRLTAGTPPVHVAVMGMERVVASWAEADLLLALLSRAGAGVSIGTYVNFITGPRTGAEMHLVIVDNGRSNILGSPSQEALNCIRCGACLNVCPAYRQIGGHAYGDVYSGPIGAVHEGSDPLSRAHSRGLTPSRFTRAPRRASSGRGRWLPGGVGARGRGPTRGTAAGRAPAGGAGRRARRRARTRGARTRRRPRRARRRPRRRRAGARRGPGAAARAAGSPPGRPSSRRRTGTRHGRARPPPRCRAAAAR